MELCNVLITAANVSEIRELIRPLDQRDEIKPGQRISTFQRRAAGQAQTVDSIVFHEEERAAICLGGDSVWGDWDASRQLIQTSETNKEGVSITYDLDGQEVSEKGNPE